MLDEADTLITLTKRYFSLCSEVHEINLQDDYPVPAQFRAQPSDRFNTDNIGSERFIVKRKGMPGHERVTAPLDAQMASSLQLMSASQV